MEESLAFTVTAVSPLDSVLSDRDGIVSLFGLSGGWMVGGDLML
jgi:hypothetical protein